MKEQLDFSSMEVASRVGKNNQWQKLKETINWGLFEKELKKTDKTSDIGGRPPYDVNKMFRVVLLGQWHDLSDEELEYSLKVRLDFLLFCGFNLSDKVPDRATINLFRNKLVSENILPKCLKLLNQELERLGLKISSSKLILDSTVIESAARARNTIEVEKQDKDNDDKNPEITKTSSKDPDARWTVKGKNFYYGYKTHALVSKEQGFIESLEVTAANVHDGKMLIEMTQEIENITEVLADKAYSSKANREYLKSRNIEDKILLKAVSKKPLTKEQVKHNQEISVDRFKVEQCFGTMKRRFDFFRASYFSIKAVKGQAILKAICVNILKAINFLKPPQYKIA